MGRYGRRFLSNPFGCDAHHVRSRFRTSGFRDTLDSQGVRQTLHVVESPGLGSESVNGDRFGPKRGRGRRLLGRIERSLDMTNNAAPPAKGTPNRGDGAVGHPARRQGDVDVGKATAADEVGHILNSLAEADSMQKIRPASLWALRVALTAAVTEGLCGEITIKIPQKSNAPVEASFRTELLG